MCHIQVVNTRKSLGTVFGPSALGKRNSHNQEDRMAKLGKSVVAPVKRGKAANKKSRRAYATKSGTVSPSR